MIQEVSNIYKEIDKLGRRFKNQFTVEFRTARDLAERAVWSGLNINKIIIISLSMSNWQNFELKIIEAISSIEEKDKNGE